MTDKIYLRPGIIETNKAKIDFLFDASEIDIVAREELRVKDIYSQTEDGDTDTDTPE